jgi:beta-galactosidase
MVPTANKEITFTLSGPGKIIGVGNGDPASHDPEQFVDSVERINIVDLKFKLSTSDLNITSTLENNDDTGWSKAFQKGYGEFETGKYILIRGTFNLHHLMDKTIITFFAKSLVEDQSVYINGKLLGKELKRDTPNQVFVLDRNILHLGENTVVFAGKPIIKKTVWEEINTNPGTLKVYSPASPWKRKTFNGLAQIIVKTTQQAGDITLTASSHGMIPALLKMKSISEISPVDSK